MAESNKGDKASLTDEELRRLRRVLRAFPDDDAIDQAAELFATYRAFERLGRLFVGALKIIAVVSAGIIAWLQLRGLWLGKGN